MSNQLSPKEVFFRFEDIRKELSTVTKSSNFHTALSLALSEFIWTAAPSSEQLAGVRTFINVLLNLPDKPEPMPSFPAKTIDHSILQNRPKQDKK